MGWGGFEGEEFSAPILNVEGEQTDISPHIYPYKILPIDEPIGEFCELLQEIFGVVIRFPEMVIDRGIDGFDRKDRVAGGCEVKLHSRAA